MYDWWSRNRMRVCRRCSATRRLQLLRGRHGFTEQCVGCQAILRGTSHEGHSEGCRAGMQHAISQTSTLLEYQGRVLFSAGGRATDGSEKGPQSDL